MAIPLALHGRPYPRTTPAQAWRWLQRGLHGRLPGRLPGMLFAALPGHDPAPLKRQADTSAPVPSLPGVVSFTALFDSYRLPLLDYLYGMTRDRELAADLTQDTFTRAFAAAPTLAEITQPRAWLYRIATHVALNANRHRRHFEWLPLSRLVPEDGDAAAGTWVAGAPIQPPQDSGDLGANLAEREAIWTVLSGLPPRWRTVLLLQTTAGFEVREIAAMLDLTEANIRKMLFRAKERFRALYTQLDVEGGEG